MWLRSVRTSQPSQGVGASRFDAAPATFAAVHSLAREYRSSRSAGIAASWSRQCEGSTQPGARASAGTRPGRPGAIVQTGRMDAPGAPLGPDTIAWHLHAAPAMLTAGLRALLLQVWHPSIASAVALHSAVARDPWHRYQSTVAFVSSVTYGDGEEAEIAIARVRAVHATVHGTDSTGRPYTAEDPDLLAYVHATLVGSALSAAAVYGS